MSNKILAISAGLLLLGANLAYDVKINRELESIRAWDGILTQDVQDIEQMQIGQQGVVPSKSEALPTELITVPIPVNGIPPTAVPFPQVIPTNDIP